LWTCNKKLGDEWKVIAAGPATSFRIEIFEEEFIEAFDVNPNERLVKVRKRNTRRN
jgi:tartrate dehydratase beta subunit/fumarate hydratase class I family protein